MLPMPERGQVIVDTTPIIALSSVGQLDLLRALFDRVIVPPAVHDELRAGGWGRPGFSAVEEAPWMVTVQLVDPSRAVMLSDLDRGEAEVIALALERGANLVILDERLARTHAKRLGLNLTGTLGLLVGAKRRALLHEVWPIVQQLREAGFRLGPAEIAEALRLAGES